MSSPTSSSQSTSALSSRTPAIAVGSEIVNEDYTGGGTKDDEWQVVKAIRDNHGNPDVLKQKLHRLRNIGDNQAGSLYEIKEVMDKYQNDPRVMAAASGALWGVTAANDDKKVEAGSSGALINTVDGLRSIGRRDADFVQWASGTLACLARGGENRQTVADAGAIEAILDALKTHQSSAGVFEWSCRALHAFVHQYEGETDGTLKEDKAKAIRQNIGTLDDNDGIVGIVTAMKSHTSDHIAQLWALKLLWRLLDRSDTLSEKRAIQKMLDADLASVCIKIIKARSATPPVIEAATGMLYNLSLASENALTEEQAADCLITVIRKMNESTDEEQSQESFLQLISVLIGSCRLQMKEANGAMAVVHTMERYPSNTEIQRSGANILWRISYIPAFFDFSCVSDAMTALDGAGKQHMTDGEFVAGACGFIANAAASGNISTSGIPIVIPLTALGNEYDDPIVIAQAGRAVGSLCGMSSSLVRRVVDGGGIPGLVDALTSKDVTDSALMAILSALICIGNASEDNKKAIVKAGCLDNMKNVLGRSTNASVVMRGLELISVVVALPKKTSQKLPNEIFQVILHSIRSVLDTDDGKERACGTLRNLMVVSTPGARTLLFDDIVNDMAGLINNPSHPVSLKREAAGVLWALTARHTKQSASDLSTMFRAVLGLMSAHKDEGTYNSDLQSIAAGALASITAGMRDTTIPISAEDVEEIIAVMYMVMEYDLERSELLEKFLDAILNLSVVDEGIVIQCGGIVVVIDAMVEHETVEEIQERGCSILALLSSTENLQVNLCIAETDGIDMIVSALAVFSSNQRILIDACFALSHLSVDHESRMLIASQGGLILVVNAMNSNQDNVDLLEGACSALLNLSSDADEQLLEDSNVIQTVVSLMKYHPDAPRLQEKALGVLQNVSMRNANAKREIAHAGGINSVTAAMKEYLGSPTVLERAFTTMWSLAVLEQNQVEIANADGISLVVNGMMANINFDKVQKQACGCLCTLSSNSRNKTLIREAGGVDAIVYAMWAHFDSEMLQIEACRALSSLAVNVQTNEVMIATDGEINAIISAMRRFSESARLQEHACVALRNFMLSSDNAVLMRSNSAELQTLMTRAAEKFPDKCAERARHVLANLQ